MRETNRPMTNRADQATVAVASYLQARAALGTAESLPRPLLPWQVAAYVAGDGEDDAALAQALRSDLRMYRLYRDLLKTRVAAVSPRQAAAQDRSESPAREGEGFRLSFRNSRADAGQVYVTLELGAAQMRPDGSRVQLHVIAADALLRLDFPPLADGRSQRLFLASSAELALLRRGDTEVLLVLP